MRSLCVALGMSIAVLPACSSDEPPSDSRDGAVDSGSAAGARAAGSGARDAASPSAAAGSGGAADSGTPAPDSGTPAPDSGTPAADSGVRNDVTANQSCSAPDPPFTSEEQMLVDLPADSWFSAPDSQIRPLCPGGNDCRNVIGAWSGGTFDPVHNQMLIFGGGHNDYSGNEVYAFELATLQWTRLTEPSPDSYKNQDPLPDGNPVSRHSYDGISYVVHADRMFVHGGSRWQDGSGTGVSWAFDPGAKRWENREPANEFPLSNCCDESSVYDPKSKRVYFHLTKFLAAYDWDENTWVKLQDYGEPPYWPRYEVWGDKRALLDSKRDLVWFFGGGLMLVYDIAGASHVTDDWITTGGGSFSNADQIGSHTEQLIETGGAEIIEGKAPGVDYDTAADDFVGWVGGAPWILDLGSKTWSRSAADGGPSEPADTGTYGRWRYVARLNVFVLVNSIDEDVWFYKHTAACGR